MEVYEGDKKEGSKFENSSFTLYTIRDTMKHRGTLS